MVFDFLEYRLYLESQLGRKGSRNGLRKKLAAFMMVHTTFVSQVLLGKADFSAEQAELVNNFLEHSDDEGEYFLFLVLHERAGNSALRSRLNKKIQKMREKRLNIQERLAVEETVKESDRLKFYSNYYYGAIHVLVSLNEFKTIEGLAQGLKLPKKKVVEMVEFMVRLGVLRKEKGKLDYGQQHIHLGKDSELVLKHHSNWRMHALSSLQFMQPEDFHYSACLTISKKDAFKVKDSILANLQKNIKTISSSPEETAYVYNIDFHSLLS